MNEDDLAIFGDSVVPQVYYALRDDIFEGRIAASELVFEADVARRFSVSKTPAREALRLLVLDGLLHLMPRRGYVVRAPGLSDILDIYHLRASIEPRLAAEAARRATVEQAELLVDLSARYSAETTWGEEVRLAVKFHHELAVASSNKRAVAIVDRLVFDAHRVWMSLRGAPPRSAYEQARPSYERLASAVRSGDAAEARDTMQGLLATAQQLLTAVAAGTTPTEAADRTRASGLPGQLL
ncbi:GntR family transcriptional regulator [Nocardia sp. CA-107356]|uniref:GntR family transcriptional regulator n=1 Tax=Nocardia sp. CA-107356 TaxID=3239972 RepID=UPI003D8F564B